MRLREQSRADELLGRYFAGLFDTIRDWIADAQASADWATKITAAVKAAVSGPAINPTAIPGSLVRIAIERAN